MTDREVLPLTISIYDRIDPEADRWARSQRDYAACHPAWVRTPGGRALHAIMDGEAVPLCGVQPSPQHRAHRWLPGHGRGSSRRHRQCAELARAETARRITALFERQRAEMPWKEASDG